MRAIAIWTALLALGAGGGAAAAENPPVGADVRAAVAKIGAGDAAGGRAELERLGAAGRLDADQALGELLFFGGPLPRDTRAACALFERSSGTWPTGMHDLAVCAEQGLGAGAPDPGKAAGLYQRAADMGMAKSKCALGNLLIAGLGVAKDERRGHGLCLEAAQAGIADAQADVGNQFLMGVGTAQDYREARRWYQLAVAQRQHQAARTLGEMYANGDGGPRSWDEAKRLWRISAEEGDVFGASLLATRLTGELLAANFRPGDPQRAADIAEAIRWSQFTIDHHPMPKEVEAAKGGLAILRGMEQAEEQLRQRSK